MSSCNPSAMTYKVLGSCSTSKARVGIISLPHHNVETPVFMPVGTKVIKQAIFLVHRFFFVGVIVIFLFFE